MPGPRAHSGEEKLIQGQPAPACLLALVSPVWVGVRVGAGLPGPPAWGRREQLLTGPQGAPDAGPLTHKHLPDWEMPRGDGPQPEHPVLPLFYLEPHLLPQQHPRVGHWRAFPESPRPSHPQPLVGWTGVKGELRGGAGASLEGTRRASWRRQREDLGMRGFPDVHRGEGCPRQRTKEDPRTEDPWGQGCKD